MDDLFDDPASGGEMGDLPSPKLAGADSPHSDGLTTEEREARRRLEYEEDADEATQPLPTSNYTVATFKLANFPIPATDDPIYHAKIPSFLALATDAFDEDTWDSSLDPSGVTDENILRWKWTHDDFGESIRESNSRIVRWSDGSLSLQLGSEFFDIAGGPSTTPTPAPAQPNYTYLAAQHEYLDLIETQASFAGSMTFRPTAIKSQTHRKLAPATGQHQKVAKTKILAMPSHDPEAEKAAREADKKAKRKARVVNTEGGPKKPRRKSIRSRRLDAFSDESDFDGEGEEEELLRSKGRASKFSKGKDEDVQDFVVPDSDLEEEARAARKAARMDQDTEMDDLDDLEANAERADRARKDKKRVSIGETSTMPPPPEETFQRRKLVVESDEDD